MAQLNFTAWLRDQAPNKPLRAEGTMVGDALAAAFTQMPHVRGYVLDDHGWLRGHVCILADGYRLKGEVALTRRIGPDSKLTAR
jgi:molybdopterin synthase sulfur carrier subunit